MTTFEWIISGMIWILVPLFLYLFHLQRKRYKQWAEEDKKVIKEFLESQER